MAAAFLTDIRSGETGLDETGDAQLIEACRRRDPEAFRSLFERYKDRVYSVALRYCGDASLAQDIAQETFIKLFSAIGSFRGDSRFESWLYRLVVNSCFDHKRKSRRLFPLVDGFLGILRAPAPSALDDMVRAERNGYLLSVVAALPPEQRMVIVLRYTEGLSYEAIAEIMGCSAGTVGSRLTRAHKLLENRLSRIPGIKSEAGGKYSV